MNGDKDMLNLILQKQYKKCLKGEPRVDNSKIYEAYNVSEHHECPHLFNGYGIQKEKQNPFYKTFNSEYGLNYPNPYSVPCNFFPRAQSFSNELAKFGMYRNYSLNTQIDHSYF